jgi:ferredoxin
MTIPRPVAMPAEARSIRVGAAAVVVAGYCINDRGRLDACDLCSRACHANAITIGLADPVVDASLCVGCGACVPACPAGALEIGGFDVAAVPGAVVQGDTARLACAASGQDGAGLVACHKMTDARLLAAIYAAGAGEIVILGTENCADCPGGDARPALAEAVQTLGKWFGEDAPKVVFAAVAEAGGASRPGGAVERRHFLRGAFRALAPEPAAAPAPPMPDFDDPVFDDDSDGAPARPVPYQALLAAARARLPFRPNSPAGATGRSIGAACSGCMACAELCPTGALGDASGAVGGGYLRQVSFDATLCTNCTLCQKICPMTAITARALRGTEAASARRAVLFARAEQVCTTCGGLFAAVPDGPRLCPGCENDKHMDDDWMDMLSG